MFSFFKLRIMIHRCLQLCTADVGHKVEKVISEETTAGANRKKE